MCLVLLMLAMPASKGLLAAEEPKTPSIFAEDTLAEATLRKIISAPGTYDELLNLDAIRRRELGAVWGQSLRGKRLKATLARFRAEAASASVKIFDAEEFRGKSYFGRKNVYYMGSNGEPVVLGIVPSVAENPQTRDDAAAVVARFIISGMAMDGLLLPAEPPSLQRETMARAIAAADRHAFPEALKLLNDFRPFDMLDGDRRPTAEVYLSLGIVEGKMPGHELRAISWLGGYLSCFLYSRAPHSAGVKAQINLLHAQNQKNLEHWLATLLDSAALLPDSEFKSWVHGRIAELQIQTGDLRGAQETVDSRVPSGQVPRDWVMTLGDDNLNHNCPLATTVFTQPGDYIKLIVRSTDDDLTQRWRQMLTYAETQIKARDAIVRMLSEVTKE